MKCATITASEYDSLAKNKNQAMMFNFYDYNHFRNMFSTFL